MKNLNKFTSNPLEPNPQHSEYSNVLFPQALGEHLRKARLELSYLNAYDIPQLLNICLILVSPGSHLRGPGCHLKKSQTQCV